MFRCARHLVGLQLLVCFVDRIRQGKAPPFGWGFCSLTTHDPLPTTHYPRPTTHNSPFLRMTACREKLGPSDFGTLSVGTEGDQVFTPSAGSSASLTANSFHLNYADGGDLGKDISGLGNHFTLHRVTQGNGGAAVVITGA